MPRYGMGGGGMGGRRIRRRVGRNTMSGTARRLGPASGVAPTKLASGVARRLRPASGVARKVGRRMATSGGGRRVGRVRRKRGFTPGIRGG